MYAKACDPRVSAGDHADSALPRHMDIGRLHDSFKPERWLDDSNKLDTSVRPTAHSLFEGLGLKDWRPGQDTAAKRASCAQSVDAAWLGLARVWTGRQSKTSCVFHGKQCYVCPQLRFESLIVGTVLPECPCWPLL